MVALGQVPYAVGQIPPPPGNVIELGPLTIHYYGIAIAIGVLVAITVLRRRYAALGGDPDLADRVALWAVGMGFVGARLGYVLPRLDRFADDPLSVLYVWQGGLAFFGGLFLGAATGIYLVRRWGGDLRAFADATAPTIPIAQAFGRWGNYFNQELYGTPTDLPWALEIEQGGQIVSTVHPTFLYEMLANLLLAGVLIWAGRSGRLKRGSLMFAYAIGYGVIRFLLELIRTDDRAFEVGLTANGWVSVLIIVIGVVGLRWWQRRPEPVAADPEEAPDDEAAPVAADGGAHAAGVSGEAADAGEPSPAEVEAEGVQDPPR